MRLFHKPPKASLFCVKGGTLTLLGQVNVHHSSGSYLIHIPKQLLKLSDNNTFYILFSDKFIQKAHSHYLQIRHGQFCLDVWLKKEITYMLPEKSECA